MLSNMYVMSTYLNIVVLLLCLLNIVTLSPTATGKYNGTLRLVFAVSRHGQRTPADTYPTDPHVNFDFYPYGWGMLTNKGKLQQYEVGKFLRQRYSDFLEEFYLPSLFWAQSTDVDRTRMGAQLLSAGLFPPKGYQKWKEDLDWQPIPVHYEPYDDDKLLLIRIPCPRYYEALEEVKKLPEVESYLTSLHDTYKFLTEKSGMNITTPDDVQSLYSTMLAETLYNLTLPEWAYEVYPDKLVLITAYSFLLNGYNDELKRLKGGPLLKKILHDSLAKANNSQSHKDIKMYSYSGHDSTISNLLLALKVWDEQVPDYNILALIELHEIDGVYGFKVFLRNSTHVEPYELTIPGCEQFCALNKAVELTKNVVPSDLKTECQSHDPNYTPPPPPSA